MTWHHWAACADSDLEPAAWTDRADDMQWGRSDANRAALSCAAPDCSRASRARGYCDTHYRRVRKWGDPTIVLKPWGTDHLQRSS